MRRLALAALIAASSCSRCERQAAPPAADLARYLPKDVEAAVVIPDLGVIGDRLSVVEHLKIASFLAGTQGFNSADELVGSVIGQVGVDLRSKEALEKAGIDPARGAGVALLSGDRAYSVVVIEDPAAFQKTIANIARTRLGAGAATHSGDVTLYAPAAGGAPQLATTVSGGVAFIASGASIPGLAKWSHLAESDSLLQEAPLQASLKRLPAPRDLWAYVPATSPSLRAFMAPSVTLSATLSAQALTVRGDMAWPNNRESLQALDKKDAADVLGLLPPDAFLVAQFSGEPSSLAPFWSLLAGPYVTKAAQESGFDVKAEVLDDLRPGAAISLAVAPTARLGAGMPELDVRRTNPFQYVHLVAAVKAKDPAKAAATLEKLPPVAERFGAHVVPAARNGHKVFLTTYAQGEGTDFALAGDTFVLAAPVSQLDATLARVDKPGAGPLADPALRGVLSAHAATLVVDLRQLADSIRALPSESWGIGGFAIRAQALRWLDATNDLRAISVDLSEKEGAVEAELSLKFTPK